MISREMICKGEICAVFRDLSSYERVDLLSTMLQLCVPLELRFIGSCLEELARRDYNRLLELEKRANDPSALNSLTDRRCNVVTDCKLTATLNVYMSLLHSDNTNCADMLFEILSSIEQTVEMYVSSESADVENAVASRQDFVTDLNLLFTLASFHPAFTFSQRQSLYTMCKNVAKLLNSISTFQLSVCIYLQLYYAFFTCFLKYSFLIQARQNSSM